jgi:hypothetical protein
MNPLLLEMCKRSGMEWDEATQDLLINNQPCTEEVHHLAHLVATYCIQRCRENLWAHLAKHQIIKDFNL